ncbi:unnamed protein product [Rotaria sordida]|uniref:Uncharacterized protein n=1 Tax=Rotaria sordida TaxID=392033 RepID=A0A815UGW8_9BILA|nr:unnamed protein product [Rotaria sordida]CAF1513792.1 unnamed protein product [Rotaria sordida]
MVLSRHSSVKRPRVIRLRPHRRTQSHQSHRLQHSSNISTTLNFVIRDQCHSSAENHRTDQNKVFNC